MQPLASFPIDFVPAEEKPAPSEVLRVIEGNVAGLLPELQAHRRRLVRQFIYRILPFVVWGALVATFLAAVADLDKMVAIALGVGAAVGNVVFGWDDLSIWWESYRHNRRIGAGLLQVGREAAALRQTHTYQVTEEMASDMWRRFFLLATDIRGA